MAMDERLTIRFSEVEAARLESLAASAGISKAGVVRMLVRGAEPLELPRVLVPAVPADGKERQE